MTTGRKPSSIPIDPAYEIPQNGVDYLKPDRLLRRFSWEPEGQTYRMGESGRARDVHKRLAVANRKVKWT
jgi:hypothetical protein